MRLVPGVDQNRTLALNEAAISTSQLIRFVPDKQGLGLVQKLGGWTRYFPTNVGSTVRALWAWQDTNLNTYLALGSQPRLSVITSATRSSSTATIVYSGSYVYAVGDTIVIDGLSNSALNGTFTVVTSTPGTITFTTSSSGSISNCAPGTIYAGDGLSEITSNYRQALTPRQQTQNVAVSASTLAGSPVVTITASGSQIYSSDTVYIETQISVGGVVLFGLYQATYVDGTNQFQVSARDATGALKNATSTVSGGGAVPVFGFVSGSAVVSVTLANHGYSVGDTFPIIVSFNAGGLTLYGNYTVISVTSSSVFSIQSSNVAKALNVTAASWSGTDATLTFSGGETYSVGDSVIVASMIPTGYNGTYTVTAATTQTVSYTVADPRITISNATWSSSGGGTATITHSGGTAFTAGQSVIIDSVNPSGYNGTYTILTAASGSFTYAKSVNPGVYVSGGHATVGGTVFQSTAKLNGNQARYIYYKVPSPAPASTGYGVGGYGAGGYGTGVTPSAPASGNPIYATDWSLDNWGRILFACPVDGAIYSWDPSVGVAQASIIPNAPPVNDGMFVAMPQRQIIAWGSTFDGIKDPLLVRWCDVDDYNTWIASVTNQAGSYRFSKGSKVVGCIQGPQQGILWTDLAVWAMQYVGPPYVYQFNEIGTGCGLISRKAATSMNGVIYWMSQSQFYRLGGAGVEIIVCPIWDVIFQDLDTDNLDKIRIAANSRFGEVTWYYPTTTSNGEVSNYAKYNVNLNSWDFGALSRTAWINQSVLGPPIGAGPSGTNNYIYQHETSTDADGQPMTSNFQTGFYQMTEGEYKIFIDQIWPDMKWGYYGGAEDADLTITFYVTDYTHETPRTYGPYAFNNQTNFITPRFRGRFVSIALQSSDLGSFWRIGGTKYRYQQDGKF